MTPTKTAAAGTRLAYLGFIDTVGFLLGGATTAPANGSGDGMLQLLGIQEAAVGITEGEAVLVPGDDGIIAQFLFSPDALPEFVMNLGAHDLDQDALLQGTLVEQLGQIKIGVLQPNSPVYPDACLIIQGEAKSKDTGSDGTKAWEGYFIPVVSLQPLGRETFAGRTAAVNRIKGVTQVASKKPWGVTITDAILGTDGAPVLPFKSNYPLTMHRYTGTGAGGQSVVLDKTPASLSEIVVHSDTALLVATTDYTISGATLTFVTNPAAGAKVVIVYGFS